jgi:hypothetical protein
MRKGLESWVRGPRKWWQVALLSAVPVAVVGAILTPALGDTGPNPGHAARASVVASSGSDASTSDVSIPGTTAPSATTAPDAPTSTTTTQMAAPTTTTLPSCTDSQFVVTVTTDRSTYMTGQDVSATAHWTNTGSTCQWNNANDPVSASGSSAYFSAPCAGWSVTDAQGQPVWQSGATPTGGYAAGTCPLFAVPNPTPGDYSYPVAWTWGQRQCDWPPGMNGQPGTWDGSGINPNCPNSQVPSGNY